MSARIENGWIVADCNAADLADTWMAIGAPQNWRPAFRDWSNGRRVAKVRATGTGRVEVWLRVGSAVSSAGRVNL